MTPALYKTRLTELFGIRHPVLCGGLMWLSDAAYVAAAVNAGALGFMTARSFPDPRDFRDELRRCRELTDGRPFGVNLYLSQQPGANDMLAGHIDILLEQGVRFIETAGLPPKDLLPRLKDAGCTVVHKVSALRHALSAQKLGVDALSVVGMECGGHPGVYLIGTMVQGLLAAQQLTLPVAIGGGIGHGAQLAAALAFGADGVVMGTRMTVAKEIWAHPAYKERVVAAGETETQLVLQSLRNTYRALDNETARSVAALEAEGVTDHERYSPHVAGTLQKEAYTSGDWNKVLLSLGQAAAFATALEPVEAIVDRMMAEAQAAQASLNAKSATSGATAAE
ncbi:MAG: nitronate monooxygenase [Rhodospirillales bacterium]|nr:nitronate monooxygenase [Rhodospirillales bacterium]